MKANRVLAAGVVILALALLTLPLVAKQVFAAGDEKPSAAGRYTVVSTDGAHIIVTDNGTSKLYFYAIDKDGKVGDELKLRGTVDLRDVGKASLKPTDVKPAK